MSEDGILFAIPAVSLTVLCVRFGGGFTGFGALTATAAVVAVAVLVVALARGGAGRLAGRSVSVGGHAHGPNGRAVIARHEAGHAAAARAVGGSVTSARVYPGESGGLVQARIPVGALPAVTFLLAGQIAAGTTDGADADDAAIRRELRGLPGRDRTRVRRQAGADAHRIVTAHATRIGHDAERLDRKGRL